MNKKKLMNEFPTKAFDSIICDFDGTITPYDVTDAVLQKFAPPEWEEVEQEWVAGKITAKRCMMKQISMIKCTKSELDNFLDAVPLTSGFQEFVDFCKESSVSLLVLSDGMDYAIKRILFSHSLGFVPVVANCLEFISPNSYHLSFPFGAKGCGSGVCKCEVAKAINKKTILIGDGRSDCCLASNADFVVAKQGKELLRHCEENSINHAEWDDFFDVGKIIKQHLFSKNMSTPQN